MSNMSPVRTVSGNEINIVDHSVSCCSRSNIVSVFHLVDVIRWKQSSFLSKERPIDLLHWPWVEFPRLSIHFSSFLVQPQMCLKYSRRIRVPSRTKPNGWHICSRVFWARREVKLYAAAIYWFRHRCNRAKQCQVLRCKKTNCARSN